MDKFREKNVHKKHVFSIEEKKAVYFKHIEKKKGGHGPRRAPETPRSTNHDQPPAILVGQTVI